MSQQSNINLNYLSPLGFRFGLNIMPNVEFHVQGVEIPGVNLGIADVASPFVRIPLSGNMTYDAFSVTFKITENFESYNEVFNWMVSLGHPDNLNPQYEKITSDASIAILNSSKRPNVNIRFTDCLPISISPITMDTTLTDVEYVTATAQFRFLRMYVEKIS